MDMQSVFNEQKAIDNKCAYLNKSKGSCSNAMKQTIKTATETKCRNINKRQSEVMFILQSKVYRAGSSISVLILLDAWLRCDIWKQTYTPWRNAKCENKNVPEKHFSYGIRKKSVNYQMVVKILLKGVCLKDI